jgi:hypothetical protein
LVSGLVAGTQCTKLFLQDLGTEVQDFFSETIL